MSAEPPEIPRHIDLPPIRLDAEVARRWWKETFQPGKDPPTTEAAVNAFVATLRSIPRYEPLFTRVFPNGQKLISARYIEFIDKGTGQIYRFYRPYKRPKMLGLGRAFAVGRFPGVHYSGGQTH